MCVTPAHFSSVGLDWVKSPCTRLTFLQWAVSSIFSSVLNRLASRSNAVTGVSGDRAEM